MGKGIIKSDFTPVITRQKVPPRSVPYFFFFFFVAATAALLDVQRRRPSGCPLGQAWPLPAPCRFDAGFGIRVPTSALSPPLSTKKRRVAVRCAGHSSASALLLGDSAAMDRFGVAMDYHAF